MIGGVISALILMGLYYALTSMAQKAGTEGRAKVRSGCGILVVIVLIMVIGGGFMLGAFDKF